MGSVRKIRISKLFTLEMGHALLGHDGQCRNIHGHSYKLYVVLRGEPLDSPGHPKDGMLMDFTDLKELVREKILDHFDHALVLNQSTGFEVQKVLQDNFEKVVLLPFQPTCENLLLHFVDLIIKDLPPSLELYGVRLDETATAYAEWSMEDL